MDKERNTAERQEICVIYTTVPPDRSGELAKKILAARLAACVSIVPVRSLYRWEGEDCDDQEHLLIIKTRRSLADQAIRAIQREHPAEVPEIIVLPVVAGHLPYLGWVYAGTEGA